MGIWTSILTGLGVFLRFIYQNLAFENYGLAIIIFTIITKLLLFPLTNKQLKSSAKMQELQPEMKKLQQQYGKNKEKLNQEMMKLYQKHNYNPASGCLPLLVQMPILIALYRVLIQPLTYMFKIPQYISEGFHRAEAVERAKASVEKLVEHAQLSATDFSNEIGVIEYFSQNPDELSLVSDYIKPEQVLNMNFLGLNLGQKPTLNFDLLFGPDTMSTFLPLLLIPILATAMTYISTKMSMARQASAATAKANPDDKAANMQKTMMYIGPGMTLYFSFILPAGMGLYWISTYTLQLVQQFFINKAKASEEGKQIVSNRNKSEPRKVVGDETKAPETSSKQELKPNDSGGSNSKK